MKPACQGIQQKIGGNEAYYSTEKNASEEGKTFVLKCSSDTLICRLKLDKGLIPIIPDQKQCDYLFVRENSHLASFDYYFIELKGSAKEADYAYEQIIQAIAFVKSKVGFIPKNAIWAFIVGGADTQNMNRLKEQFRKYIGVMLKHNTGKRYEHQIR